MQPHDRLTRTHEQNSKVKARELLDWAQESFDTTSIHDSGNKQRTTETDSLERWLSDSVVHGDPWKDAAGTVTMSPIPTEDPDRNEGPTSRLFGFDDDFTVFVSAPAVEDGLKSNGVGTDRSEPGKMEAGGDSSFESDMNCEGDEDETRLSAGIGGHYASLGSASDFGGSENGDSHAEYECMKDSEDDGLPTEEEIRATSARIFGTVARTRVVDAHAPTSEQNGLFHDISSSSSSTASVLSEPHDGNSEDEYDAAPFDLSRVLTALEEMKAEVAGIEDEGEKRKAAARVALGLVHGLEGDNRYI